MTSYQYNLVQFKNNRENSDRLTLEIQNSVITIALDHIDTYNDVVSIFFKADLTTDDKLLLDNIVANHTGEPMPEETPIVRAEILTEHLKYVESGDVTQTLFACESVVLDVPSGITQCTVDVSWKYNISLKSGTLPVAPNMVGDELIAEMAPNTLIGAVVIPVNIGDEIIYVSPTVLQNIKIGYFLNLYPSGIELGKVIEIGVNNVKLDKPVVSNISPGTYLSMTVKMVPYLYFSTPYVIDIGKGIPAGNRIPKNTKMRLIYKNNNGIAKKVSFFIEYLY